jgi:tetratricopeptide (TPR) repeat protein
VFVLLVLFVLLFWRTLPRDTTPVDPDATVMAVQVTLNAPVVPGATFPTIHPTAQPGEILLVVAPFAGYTVNEQYNVAGRLQEALNDEIANARLISTTIALWPEQIPNRAYLEQVLAASNAALLIWGEYDSGRVRVNLDGISNVTQKRDFPLSSPTELITTISNTLPREIRMLALTALGRLLRNQGNVVAAQSAFTRALALEPGDSKTRALLNFYLGYLAERGGQMADLDQAIRYYNTALAENPLLYDARYNLGTVYLNRAYRHAAGAAALRTDLDAAIDELTTVISVRPAYLLAYHNRGVARYERNQGGDLTAALNDFSRVIAFDAQNSRAYFHRALTAIRAGEGEQWVADFEKTLALEPGYYAAYNGLCWGYALAQEAVRALPHCDQAVALDPTGASRDSRGIVYAQMDRYADAVADFNVYLEWLQAEVDPTLYERYRGPLVETWIEALNQGENPFTPAVLASLR